MKFVRVAVLLAFASCVGSTHAQTRVVKNDAPAKRNVVIRNATHFLLFETNRMQFYEEVLKFIKE